LLGKGEELMRYALGRIGYAVSLMAATIVISFALFQLVPTDPARIALGGNASNEQVAALRAQLGLDRPVPEQLASYLGDLFSGDLGHSFIDGRPVAAEVLTKLGLSAALTLFASAIAAAYVIAQLSSSREGTAQPIFWWLNRLFTILPTMFVAAVTLSWLFPLYPYNYFPGTLAGFDGWAFLLPPAMALALYPMGILGKIADSEFQRLASQPFIEAAKARGLAPERILWRYMFPNALITLLSSYATLLPILLTGSFIVEIMFSVPGLGALLLKSVLNRDLTMLQGIVIVGTALAIVIHLLIELAYPAIDPRIAEQGIV
jgi:peptide/nickel transport system permease protein